MTEKQEAQKRVAAAEKACASVLSSSDAARVALSGGIITNGLGIFRDRFEVRNSLLTARENIDRALKELGAIEWPTDADYDFF